ncbi:hypothetical protein HJG60_010939 [Phyllostomus discolor]|uniref:Uncharacterized protein n=1 Tax=Phyllostomus discolor TaxID=89673 RepID=A0A834A7X7_9CHIR|nr:hypothetical protein HJG60_010939 [Phyllostomus discolor]
MLAPRLKEQPAWEVCSHGRGKKMNIPHHGSSGECILPGDGVDTTGTHIATAQDTESPVGTTYNNDSTRNKILQCKRHKTLKCENWGRMQSTVQVHRCPPHCKDWKNWQTFQGFWRVPDCRCVQIQKQDPVFLAPTHPKASTVSPQSNPPCSGNNRRPEPQL